MPKPIFQFRLRKDATTYYYIDGGVVNISATPVTLKQSVSGWDSLQVVYRRHSVYKGVFRKYMPDTVRFVKDGAKILQWVFKNKGYSEAICQFEILKLNSSTLTYKPYVICDLDFSKYKGQQFYGDVMMMEAGITAKLNAYDTTTYSLQIGEPQAPGAEPVGAIGPPKDIFMNGIPFIETYNYQTKAGDTITVSSGNPEKTIGIVYIDRKDLYFNIQDSFSTGVAQSVDSGQHPIASTMSMFNATSATDIASITVDINIDSIVNGVASACTYSIFARVYDAGGSTHVDNLVYSITIPAGATVNPGLISTTIPSYIGVIGDSIVLFLSASANGGTMTLDNNPTDITISYNQLPPQSVISAYSQWQVLQMLTDNLISTNPIPAGTSFPLLVSNTPAPPATYSNLPAPPCKSDLLTTSAEYFDVDPTQTYFTSSRALQKIQYSSIFTGGAAPLAYLNMSMKDYIQDAFVSNCAGLGVEKIAGVDTLVLEHLSHFYQAGVKIADLGSRISNFTIEPYVEYLANNIEFGYKENNYEDGNGNWEFNRTSKFFTQVTREQQDIDLKSPFRADPYGVAMQVINVSTQISTSAKDDNDVFKLQSDGVDAGLQFGYLIPPYDDPIYKGSSTPLPALNLKRMNGVTVGLPQIGVTNGVADFAFNVPLSPKRQIKRLLPWLKSVFYNIPGNSMSLTPNSRMVNFISSMVGGAGLIDEFENIDLTPAPGEILFKPIIFEFTTQVPIDLVDLMDANPYGVFGFTYKSTYMEGFVLEAGVTPGKNDTFNFKLLCSPNSDMPEYL